MVLDAVGWLSEQVAAERACTSAVKATLERSAVKGQAYEDQVVPAVTAIAAARGDIAEFVGRLSRSTGGLVSDIVVDVETSSTGGACGRYVLECKDRRLTVKAILDELRRAAKNRDAHSVIAVFSRADHAPVPDPFTVFDDLATPNANSDTSATARAQHFCLPASHQGLLEPDAVKVARPGSEGAGRSNAPGQPDHPTTVGAGAFEPFADHQRQAHPHVSLDLVEKQRRVAVPGSTRPSRTNPVDGGDDHLDGVAAAWTVR